MITGVKVKTPMRARINWKATIFLKYFRSNSARSSAKPRITKVWSQMKPANSAILRYEKKQKKLRNGSTKGCIFFKKPRPEILWAKKKITTGATINTDKKYPRWPQEFIIL